MLSDLRYRLRALFRRATVERELHEELRAHIEQQIEQATRRGATREEAERSARLDFGGLDQVKEACRDVRGLGFLETLQQDVRYGVRGLRKNPVFTAASLFTLAVGIGACTAVFSVVNGVLLRPLAYDEADRLVFLFEDPSGKRLEKNSVAAAQFADWSAQARSFEAISAIRRERLNLTGDGQPERLVVHRVSASYLRILRLNPALGRGFLPNEDQPGHQNVIVLTHGLWQRHFGGASDVVGRSVRLGGQSHSIIGVLPAWPPQPLECDALAPFVVGSEAWHRSRNDHRLRVIGRLKAGVTFEVAQSEMDRITLGLKPLYPSWKQAWGVNVVSVHDETTGAVRRHLWVLFGAVAFVALIACANVAGLLLARTAGRQREMALRASLGAGRGRVIRQLLTEGLLLSLLGGALGTGLATWGVRVFAAVGSDSVPRMEEVGIDPLALGFALSVILGAGVVFGLAPALHLARPKLGEALRQEGRILGGRWAGRLRAALVVGEVALALSLLVGAGLMLRTLLNLQAVPAGFDAHSALAMDLSFDDGRHRAGDERARFLRDIVHGVESLPGVEAAGAATTLPTAGFTDGGVRDERRPDQDEFYISADYDFVSGRFFRAMGMTLVRGRVFEEHDDSSAAPRVSVINEALAARLFLAQDAVGRRVRFQGQSWEVIGVIGNVRHHGLDSAPKEHIYVPQAFGSLPCTLVVRTKIPPLTLAESVRGAITSLDPGQPVSNVRTLGQVLGKTNATRRLTLGVLACFAATAVLLAAVGLYGVIAYSIGRRTREIGVRMALGARAGSVLGEVMRQGLGLAILGVAAGVCGTLVLSRVLGNLLFGVTPQDPLTFVGAAALLVFVAAAACWGPARRAMNVDPVEALRHE